MSANIIHGGNIVARHVHLLRQFCPCLDSVTPLLILSGIKVFQLECFSGIFGEDAFTAFPPLWSFPSKVKLQWRAYLKVFVDERLPVRFDLSELWPQPFDLALHSHDILKVPLRPQVQHLNWLRHVLHLLKRMEQHSIDFPVRWQIKMSTMFSRSVAELPEEWTFSPPMWLRFNTNFCTSWMGLWVDVTRYMPVSLSIVLFAMFFTSWSENLPF